MPMVYYNHWLVPFRKPTYCDIHFLQKRWPLPGIVGNLIAWHKSIPFTNALQWRHDEGDGVSNHRRLDYLLSRLFRRISKKTSKFRATGLCEGNPPVTYSLTDGQWRGKCFHLMTSSWFYSNVILNCEKSSSVHVIWLVPCLWRNAPTPGYNEFIMSPFAYYSIEHVILVKN